MRRSNFFSFYRGCSYYLLLLISFPNNGKKIMFFCALNMLWKKRFSKLIVNGKSLNSRRPGVQASGKIWVIYVRKSRVLESFFGFLQSYLWFRKEHIDFYESFKFFCKIKYQLFIIIIYVLDNSICYFFCMVLMKAFFVYFVFFMS